MNNTIFWKCVTRPFRWIYVNFFNSFRFLAEVIKNCTFLGNLRIITQKGNMETRQMTQFFSCYFSALTVCNIYFWIRKYSKFIFIWSPFGPFWNTSVFGQKLPIWADHYTFPESRHPDVTKNFFCVLSSHGLIPTRKSPYQQNFHKKKHWTDPKAR